jgi:hypothetical protein
MVKKFLEVVQVARSETCHGVGLRLMAGHVMAWQVAAVARAQGVVARMPAAGARDGGGVRDPDAGAAGAAGSKVATQAKVTVANANAAWRSGSERRPRFKMPKRELVWRPQDQHPPARGYVDLPKRSISLSPRRGGRAECSPHAKPSGAGAREVVPAGVSLEAKAKAAARHAGDGSSPLRAAAGPLQHMQQRSGALRPPRNKALRSSPSPGSPRRAAFDGDSVWDGSGEGFSDKAREIGIQKQFEERVLERWMDLEPTSGALLQASGFVCGVSVQGLGFRV